LPSSFINRINIQNIMIFLIFGFNLLNFLLFQTRIESPSDVLLPFDKNFKFGFADELKNINNQIEINENTTNDSKLNGGNHGNFLTDIAEIERAVLKNDNQCKSCSNLNSPYEFNDDIFYYRTKFKTLPKT